MGVSCFVICLTKYKVPGVPQKSCDNSLARIGSPLNSAF